MPSAKVILDDRFSRFGRDTERGVERAIGKAASVTVAVARQNPGEYAIDPILSTVRATPAHRIRKGWRVFVYVDDFRGVFFAKGTYARRRAKLSPQYRRTAKAEAIAAESGTGVKPTPFLTRAVKVARERLLAELQREIGR